MSRPRTTDEALIADLIRVYHETGSCTSTTYLRQGRHGSGTVYSRFGIWSAFVTAAGLSEALPAGKPYVDSRVSRGRAVAQALDEQRALRRAKRSPRGIKPCLKCRRKFETTPTNWFICTRCTKSWDWAQADPMAV